LSILVTYIVRVIKIDMQLSFPFRYHAVGLLGPFESEK
jgi:hypothetical protein